MLDVVESYVRAGYPALYIVTAERMRVANKPSYKDIAEQLSVIPEILAIMLAER